MFTWLWLYGKPTQIHSNSYQWGIPRLWTCVTHLMFPRPIPPPSPPLTRISAISMQLTVFFLWFIISRCSFFSYNLYKSFWIHHFLTQFMLIFNIISISVVFVNQHLPLLFLASNFQFCLSEALFCILLKKPYYYQILLIAMKNFVRIYFFFIRKINSKCAIVDYFTAIMWYYKSHPFYDIIYIHVGVT